MSGFKLDSRLKADCFHIGDLPLSRVFVNE